MDIDSLVARLKELDALRESDTVNRSCLERIQPSFADEWPTELDSGVRDALVRFGAPRPYAHQAEAIARSLSGCDVVMESPTASGKTLSFTAPMLQMLKREPGSHAMMLYPMKALAFDQRDQIRRLCEPLGIESWPYDGDTDEEHKALMRANPPRILLTNPEYLNMSFLGNRESWDKHAGGFQFLRSLRYIVIDEMHEYRGFFGSNMALLLRRFFVYLDRIGVHPQIFLSTATCANPQEHAKALVGRDVELVSARGALRPKRNFVFVNPEIPDYRYWDILRLRVEQAALTVLEEGLQALVFCPTKRFLEAVFGASRRRAKERGLDPDQLSAYHADLKAEDRQRIQGRIKSGDIKVAFTTNALEIGLDVGGLDGVILAGFPPSITSAWQQLGRAGRSWDKDAFVLFYAMNDPIDRFFVHNLDTFLTKPFDELVIDPANEELIERHLPSLVEETGGTVEPAEEAILGSPFYSAIVKARGVATRGYKPQPRLNLRGGIGQSYSLMSKGQEIGQISTMRRFHEAYIGAIFPFFGQRHHVRSHEEGKVVLEDLEDSEQHLRTDGGFYSLLYMTDIFEGFRYRDISVHYGSHNIAMNFTGYKVVDERSGDVVRVGGDDDALFLRNLHSFWIDLPQSEEAIGGIGAVEHMLRVGAMFVIPADRFDTNTYSMTSAGDSSVAAYYYENYPGGIGVAKKLFSVWDTALAKGIEVARNCRCSSGCQNCIEPAKSWGMSNGNIDKVKGIELGERLLSAARKGPDYKFLNGLMRPIC